MLYNFLGTRRRFRNFPLADVKKQANTTSIGWEMTVENMPKKTWIEPRLEELSVEQTLNGPVPTGVETVVKNTGAPYGYGIS